MTSASWTNIVILNPLFQELVIKEFLCRVLFVYIKNYGEICIGKIFNHTIKQIKEKIK